MTGATATKNKKAAPLDCLFVNVNRFVVAKQSAYTGFIASAYRFKAINVFQFACRDFRIGIVER